MNKVQYIKLLELRGITELKGMSIGQAVRDSGGDPTQAEMVKVNEMAMKYYIDKYTEEQIITARLKEELVYLVKRSEWLSCLEQAGVDNWEGHDITVDILEGKY